MNLKFFYSKLQTTMDNIRNDVTATKTVMIINKILR